MDAYSMANGYQVTKRFLDSNIPATAFFAISDNVSFGVCKAIYDAGKRIPEDYSVAGFDGIEMGKYYYPTLTTMRQPCEEMVRETMKILFSRIEDGKGNKHKVFEAELQEGGSVRRIKA